MFSNVIMAYCAGNRRAAYRSRLSQATNQLMIGKVLGEIDAWDVAKTTQTDKGFTADMREHIKRLEDYLNDFLKSLLTHAEQVPDLGAANLQTLRADDKRWSSTFVSTPSLGYPRLYLGYKPNPVRNIADPQSKTIHTVTAVPNPCSQWSRGIAECLLELDRGRFTSELIPGITNVGHHTGKDQPFGAFLSLREQLREVQRIYLVYAIQGCLLVLHANQRLLRKQWELSYAVDQRARLALEVWKDAYDYLLTLPLHPLIAYIANALNTGTIKTYHGTHDVLYRFGEAVTANGGKDDLGELRMLVLNDAVSDMAEKGTKDIWGCGKSSADEHPLRIGQFARQLRGTAVIVDGIKTTVSHLQWPTLSGNIGEMWQAGAEFMICDGLGYSGPATAGLLGLRPVLSLGNVKSIGVSRRTQSNFNVISSTPDPGDKTGKKLIEYSAMVVDGYQTPTAEGQTFERLYLPAGMWMGEPDTTTILAPTIIDPVLTRLLDFFEAQNPEYVEQFYGEPDIASTDVFQRTDWDGWAIATDESSVRNGLKAGYINQVEAAKTTRYITRERFYHRFVVRRSWNHRPEMYDEFGKLKFVLTQDGNILFNEKLDIKDGTADLEAIVNVAPTQSNLTHQLPASVAGDQVKVT